MLGRRAFGCLHTRPAKSGEALTAQEAQVAPGRARVHLKTSNPIVSTFRTVRPRTRATKGPGSRAAGLMMVFKLIERSDEAGTKVA